MAVTKLIFAAAMLVAFTNAQRPSFAGLRPIGIPAVQSNVLANRFGESADLPIEAKGDGNLVNTLEQRPVDKQPFWYINSKFYDAQRKNPQTYPQRPGLSAGNQAI